MSDPSIQSLLQRIEQVEQKVEVGILKQEAHIRYLVESKNLTYDDHLLAIGLFQQYILKLQELRRIESLLERLDKAKKYNVETTDYRVYADDLGFIEQIKKVGEITKKTANKILELPHTTAFEGALFELVEKEEIENKIVSSTN